MVKYNFLWLYTFDTELTYQSGILMSSVLAALFPLSFGRSWLFLLSVLFFSDAYLLLIPLNDSSAPPLFTSSYCIFASLQPVSNSTFSFTN